MRLTLNGEDNRTSESVSSSFLNYLNQLPNKLCTIYTCAHARARATTHIHVYIAQTCICIYIYIHIDIYINNFIDLYMNKWEK